MTKQETIKKLQNLENLFNGLAGYHGLVNFRLEKDGKKPSEAENAYFKAYGFCADEVKSLIEEISK